MAWVGAHLKRFVAERANKEQQQLGHGGSRNAPARWAPENITKTVCFMENESFQHLLP